MVFAVAADRGARHQFYHAFRGRRIVYGTVVDIFSVGDALAGALAGNGVFGVCAGVGAGLH